ncbi:MAG: hypothetical protein ABI980_11365 [Nitrospirota bacterium]
MHKQLGTIGAIRRELQGKNCPSCGGNTYRLVLRADTPSQTGTLFARCSQCERPRKLTEAIGRMLWM